MMKHTKFAMIFLLSLLVSFGILGADSIQLKNGTVLEGKIVGQSQETIRFSDGKEVKEVKKNEIRRIQYGQSIKKMEEALRKRREAARLRRERIVREQQQAEALATQQQQENDRRALQEQLAKLTNEAKELEAEIQSMEEEKKLLEDEKARRAQIRSWLKEDDIRVLHGWFRTGTLEWKSSALKSGMVMLNSRFVNNFLGGRQEPFAAYTADSSTSTMFQNFEFGIDSYSDLLGITNHYTLLIMTNRFPTATKGTHAESAFLFPLLDATGGSVSVTQFENQPEVYPRPLVTKLGFTYLREHHALQDNEIEPLRNLTFNYGLSVFADDLHANGAGFVQRDYTMTTTSTLAQELVSAGSGVNQLKLVYTRGLFSLNLGAAYSYEFLKMHKVDVRADALVGRGFSNFTQSRKSVWTIYNIPLIYTLEYNGDTREKSSGYDAEVGYTLKIAEGTSFRMAYRDRYQKVIVTDSTVSSTGDWLYVFGTLLQGNAIPYILDDMDALGPYPTAVERVKGVTFQIIMKM